MALPISAENLKGSFERSGIFSIGYIAGFSIAVQTFRLLFNKKVNIVVKNLAGIQVGGRWGSAAKGGPPSDSKESVSQASNTRNTSGISDASNGIPIRISSNGIAY